MMRVNVATTKLVSEYVTADGVDWLELREELEDPDRRELPGGKTVGERARSSTSSADDIDRAVGGCWATEQEHGLPYALTRFALPAVMACKGWFGTPWWPEVVEEFMKGLDEPDFPAWKHDDRSKPEPPVVADRAVLRQTLLSAPEELDGDTAWWCLQHGLGHCATHRAYVRWRKQREAEWDDPVPYLLH